MNTVCLAKLIEELESGSRPKGGIKEGVGEVISVGAEHLSDTGSFNFKNIKRIPQAYYESMTHGRISPSDILVVKDGATTGKVSFVDSEFPFKNAAINEHVFRIKVDERQAIPAYIYRYLQSSRGKSAILSDFRGATVGGMSRDFVNRIELPLPSLPEQRRIAAILDKADAIRRKRKEAIKLIESFLRSVFIDMFGDPVTNSKGWDTASLELVCNKITDGTHKTPAYQNNGIIFISAKNISGGEIDWDDVKFISAKEHSELIKRCKPELDDIMLSKSGSIGTAVVVNRDVNFSLFESLALLKLKRDYLAPEYLCGLLNNSKTRDRYLKSVKGISIKHLHLEDIRRICIPLPPINLQNKFVSLVNRIEQIKRKQKESFSEMNNNFNALMQRCFG